MNEGMNKECVVGTERSEYLHEELANAIHNVNSINDHLNELIYRVRAEPNAYLNEPIPEMSSLRSVLVTGKDSLRDYTENAHAMIDELAALLFNE